MEKEELLTPSEVAKMFRVNPKTVTRWARSGKISAIRTLGGHRRFRASEIEKFLAEAEVEYADKQSPAIDVGLVCAEPEKLEGPASDAGPSRVSAR